MCTSLPISLSACFSGPRWVSRWARLGCDPSPNIRRHFRIRERELTTFAGAAGNTLCRNPFTLTERRTEDIMDHKLATIVGAAALISIPAAGNAAASPQGPAVPVASSHAELLEPI